jgi:predicted O-linked N-acetylglucosamine transferase (SPINDLY family)
MGSLQTKPAIIPIQRAGAAGAHGSVTAWLDGLLAGLASGDATPWYAEDIRRRLQHVPFEAVLAAIERAGPDLGAGAEISLHEQWIAANAATSPLLHAAWFSLGVLFARDGHLAQAAIAYGNALALRPDMHCAAVNLGLLQEAIGQPEQALATWKAAEQPEAARLALEIQQGRLLERLGRLEEAESILRRVLIADAAQTDVIHHWVHIRQKMCLWPAAPPDVPGVTPEDLVRGCSPLGLLALTDDIDLQRDGATAWVTRKTTPAPRRLAPPRPYGHARTRIGYLSSDFGNHAMSYLITELFERHDRGRFEVFGYCAGRDDGTPLRQRVLAAFDQCRLIRTLPDEQAAQLIRDDEIDVLIDLNGITDGSRLAVLRWRPAPIQATYLGFVGPVPLPELDCMLCDGVVIPPEHAAAYQPTPLPIGRVFQANDGQRTLGRQLSRAKAGLPADGFVFCCFSGHYKITEAMFGAWMSILRQVDRSVLWLVADNPYSQRNLLAAADHAGVAGERLIFSERADPDLYLSRLAAADLFLDTFPYNAGTVASDAIRMGLPLVTLCGRSYASRMATSLLLAIDASAGVTTSLARYVETAIRLASEPADHARYKALFTAEAWGRTIGDIDRFTRDFEATLQSLVHRD